MQMAQLPHVFWKYGFTEDHAVHERGGCHLTIPDARNLDTVLRLSPGIMFDVDLIISIIDDGFERVVAQKRRDGVLDDLSLLRLATSCRVHGLRGDSDVLAGQVVTVEVEPLTRGSPSHVSRKVHDPPGV